MGDGGEAEDRKTNQEPNVVVQLRKCGCVLEYSSRGCRCGKERERFILVRVWKKIRGTKQKLSKVVSGGVLS